MCVTYVTNFFPTKLVTYVTHLNVNFAMQNKCHFLVTYVTNFFRMKFHMK